MLNIYIDKEIVRMFCSHSEQARNGEEFGCTYRNRTGLCTCGGKLTGKFKSYCIRKNVESNSAGSKSAAATESQLLGLAVQKYEVIISFGLNVCSVYKQ